MVDAKLVEQLARLETRDSSRLDQRARAFVSIHSDPAYGWHVARAFARAKKTFPVTVIGRDRWLFSAYLMHLNPTAYGRCEVETAFKISQQPDLSAKLKALLITGLGNRIDEHLSLVAEKIRIPRFTVEAFEILFFNVLDRHQDGLYLSSLTYPDGRLVELAEDYFDTTPIADLLLRTAYNSRDIELVSHLACLDRASLAKERFALRESGAEAELEKKMMGNALLMAKLGLLNQRSVGLQRATRLLAARRGPLDTTTVVEDVKAPYLDVDLAAALAAVPPITEADRQDLRASVRPGRSYYSDETGAVFPFDEPIQTTKPVQSADQSAPIVWFPEPIPATWRNKDSDTPVILVARMSEPGLPDHYLADGNIGVPVSEVCFD